MDIWVRLHTLLGSTLQSVAEASAHRADIACTARGDCAACCNEHCIFYKCGTLEQVLSMLDFPCKHYRGCLAQAA